MSVCFRMMGINYTLIINCNEKRKTSVCSHKATWHHTRLTQRLIPALFTTPDLPCDLQLNQSTIPSHSSLGSRSPRNTLTTCTQWAGSFLMLWHSSYSVDIQSKGIRKTRRLDSLTFHLTHSQSKYFEYYFLLALFDQRGFYPFV